MYKRQIDKVQKWEKGKDFEFLKFEMFEIPHVCWKTLAFRSKNSTDTKEKTTKKTTPRLKLHPTDEKQGKKKSWNHQEIMTPNIQGIVVLKCSQILFFLYDVWFYLFVTQKISFSSGFKLRCRSSQRGQSLSLGNLFLTFFLAFLHALSQKLIIFYTLSLIFLSPMFLQSNTPMFVLQDTWSNKMLNLRHLGPRCLIFFV